MQMIVRLWAAAAGGCKDDRRAAANSLLAGRRAANLAKLPRAKMSVRARAAASLLKTSVTASATEKKAAFRAMAKLWHPDLHQGKPSAAEAEATFKRIIDAFNVLQDPSECRAENPAAGERRSSAARGGARKTDWRTSSERAQQRSDFSARYHAHYAQYAAAEEPPPNYAAIILPAMLFASGLFALVWSRHRNANAALTQKHDHDWISRRSMGGFRGYAAAPPRRRKSAEGGASSKPHVGEGGLPRQAAPYQGGAATAAAGIRIGDPAVGRDWYRERPGGERHREGES